MASSARSHKEDLQRKILKKKPEIIYRRNIQRLFECLNYVDTDVIENAVVLLPDTLYNFLEDFDMKDKIIDLWHERVKHVYYHTEEQMKEWFVDCLKTENTQNIYRIAFGGDSNEKPIILIHVAFDQIGIYYQHQGEIRKLMEEYGTKDFLKNRGEKYPEIFYKMKEVLKDYMHLDILLNINGFSIIPKKNSSSETEQVKEEEYLDEFDKTLMEKFNESNEKKKKIEEAKGSILFAELQDHYRLINFDQEQNYLFYRCAQKFFFEFFPYKEIVMNCFNKNPIHICRAGYLVTHPEVQLCILDDWDIATIWIYSNEGKIIYHQGIVKDMSLFSNQLKDNLVDEIRYFKRANKEDEALDRQLKLRSFMSRFTEALCLPDVI